VLWVCSVCRTDFTGRGELADRQQKLGQMLALLKKVCLSASLGNVSWPKLDLRMCKHRSHTRGQCSLILPSTWHDTICCIPS
jgi:hypothetical protein